MRKNVDGGPISRAIMRYHSRDNILLLCVRIYKEYYTLFSPFFISYDIILFDRLFFPSLARCVAIFVWKCRFLFVSSPTIRNSYGRLIISVRRTAALSFDEYLKRIFFFRLSVNPVWGRDPKCRGGNRPIPLLRLIRVEFIRRETYFLSKQS